MTQEFSQQLFALPEKVAGHEARLDALETWQSRQNGTLQRLEDKIDRLNNLLLCGAFTALIAACGWAFVLLGQKH